MEGSNAPQQDGTPPEQRSPDQDAAAEAALLAGTLPDHDRRANAGAEGPEDEAEIARRDAEDLALIEAQEAEQLASGEPNIPWEEAKRQLEVVEVSTSTLAAVHQFLATLSGPEATRAQALRAQLPPVPA